MSETYRLTNGEITKDVDAYLEDWGRYRKSVEAIGLRLIGFDPGLLVCDAETGQGTFTLPLYAAKRIFNPS